MSGNKARGGNSSPHLRDRLLTLEDLAKLPPTKPLIDNLVYRNTLAQLSGGPGSYKSFLAITLSCCLAAKEPFGEFNVPEQGTVVYVAAEGANDVLKRILGWCEMWEVSPDTVRERLAPAAHGRAVPSLRLRTCWESLMLRLRFSATADDRVPARLVGSSARSLPI